MRTVRRIVGFAFILFLLFSPRQKVIAAISECTASLSPTNSYRSSAGSLTFSVKNTDGATAAVWIKITHPDSGSFRVDGASATGWVAVNDTASATLTGSLAAGAEVSVSVNIYTVSGEVGSENWTVQVSDSDSGSGAKSCTGSLTTTVSGSPPAGPAFGTITVSGISDSQATISWDTDQNSDSTLNWGTTDAYGSTKSDTISTTSHSLAATGLSANTTYHYQVLSANGIGTADSGDQTFTTAAAGATTTTVTTTVSTTVTRTITPKPTPTPVPDRTPPSVTLTTDFTKPFAAAPTIKGKATDPSGVSANIEYSLDDGKSWAPVDLVDSPGKASTTFSFTPVGLLDDNYTIRIRATDGKGNTGVTRASWTMVIDRLPPLVGAGIITLGPQVLPPTAECTIVTVAGIHPTLTVSAIGGPTEITLVGPQGPLGPLQKNSDTGLWSIALSFDIPGNYALSTHAVDGAGNIKDRVLNTIVVQPGGMILGAGKSVAGATVAAYVLDPSTHTFVLWDAAAYGQENPQKTSSTGEYRLSLPRGTYYLRVTAFGYRSLVTDIFTTSDAYALHENFSLTPGRSFRLGPWTIPLPDFRQESTAVTISSSGTTQMAADMHPIGAELPYFSFPWEKTPITATSLRGKPTIITFLTSWSPQTASQLTVLNDVVGNKEIHSLVIIPQETVSSVAIFRKRGGYTVPIVADPDGTLVEPLNIQSVPTHVFISRKGTIQSVVSGVLSKKEILNKLVQ